MTLGGQGTAAQAAAADDTELTHGYWYGGYRPYYGYRPYWGGYYGFRPYWGGYYGGFAYRPYGFYNPYRVGYYGVYRPFYFRSYYGFGGYACWIAGDGADVAAPVMTLGMRVAENPFVKQETGTPTSKPAAPVTTLPVSIPAAKTTSPYTFKAYGEK
jgi:hypothetical protein